MAKKDFSKAGAELAMSKIAEATAAPEITPEPETVPEEKKTPEAPEKKTRKPRKQHTQEEIAEAQKNRQTAGIKGATLPRLNISVTPEQMDFVETMCKAMGRYYSEFIGDLLDKAIKEDATLYRKAKTLQAEFEQRKQTR